MNYELKKQAAKYSKRRMRKVRSRRITAALSALVTVGALWAMSRPALTMNPHPGCGLEEHSHSVLCYDASVRDLACTAAVHMHADACKGADGDLTCGIADFILHAHDDTCYKDGVLVCALAEVSGHTHTEGCYQETTTYACGQEAVEPHPEHTTDCYGEPTLNCTIQESDEHAHEDACYQQNQICTKELTAGHVHDDTCAPQTEKNQTCTIEVVVPHTHTAECYDAENNLVCGKRFITQHVHTADCFTVAAGEDTEGNLTCVKEVHQHSDACYLSAAALEDVSLTGNWAADTLAITQSYYNDGYVQETDADGNPYTVFGDAFNNSTTTEWNTHFIGFCLNNAGVDSTVFPIDVSNAEGWKNSLSEAGYYYEKSSGYSPVAGDIVFWSPWDPTSYNVGIVTSTDPVTFITADSNEYDGKIGTLVEWNCNVFGYARIPNKDGTLEQTINAKVYTDNTYTTEDTSVTAVVEGMLPVNAEICIYPLTLTAEQTAALSSIGDPLKAYHAAIFVNGTEYTGTIESPVSIQLTSDEFAGDAALMPYRLQESQIPEKLPASASGSTITVESTIPVDFAMVGVSSVEVTTAAELKSAVESGIPEITLGADIAVDAENDGIEISKNVIIDLNGKTLIAAGDETLFVIATGGELTMDDSKNAKVGTVEGVNPIGRPTSVNDAKLGSVNQENGKAKLIYYTTRSVDAVPDVQYDNGATDEYLDTHTVNAAGMVENKTIKPLFTVDGGTLNITDGVYAGNLAGGDTGRAIVLQNGATADLSGGYIAGFHAQYDVEYDKQLQPESLELSRNHSYAQDTTAYGGAIHASDSTLNIKGTVIAGNTARSGGAVYANNVNIVFEGGVVSGNAALGYSPKTMWEAGAGPNIGGGGFYLNGNSTITINDTDSYITNNKANAEGYADGGGAIFARHGSTITINAGYITSNAAGGGGGAIRTIYGWPEEPGSANINVYIKGGYICSNICQNAEGGGVSINSGARCYVTGGYINNNVTMTQRDWGGGGLFNAKGSYLELKNVLVTENMALGLGGGVGGCSTGDIHLAVTEGGALFDNTAMAQNWSGEGSQKREDWELAKLNPNFDLENADDYFCVHNSKVEAQMLGRGSADWVGTVDDQRVFPPHTAALEAHSVMGLNANPMAPGKMEARMHAKGYINGNFSNVHGGGIMCNGILDVGVPVSDDSVAYLTIAGTKSLADENNAAKPMTQGQFEFTVTNDFGEVVSVGTNDANGNITFARDLLFLFPGTFTYTVAETDLGQSGITYDPAAYIMTVVVAEDQDTKEYKVTSVTIQKTGESQANSVAISSANAPTYALENFAFAFSNQISEEGPETTSVSVTKKWMDTGYESKRPASIKVNLLQGETVFKTAELSASNNWAVIWNDLPKLDDNGDAFVYTVEEADVEGYISGTVAVAGGFEITNTYNLTSINVKKVWNDIGYETLTRPESVTVILNRNGEKHSEKVLNADNNWQDSWTNLPVKDGSGIEYKYEVAELAVPGYTSSVAAAGSDVVITNTLKTTSVEVEKKWEDQNDIAKLRPASITVELKRNGTKIDEKELNAANSWKGSWTGLPVTDQNGMEYGYTVTEKNVSGNYEAKTETTAAANGTKILITNTLALTSIEVEKKWEDSNNAAGKRPGAIQVALLRNGETFAVANLSDVNSWKAVWKDLVVKDANGDFCEYLVEEVEVPANYDSVVKTNEDGSKVTITNTWETTSVHLLKYWNDNGAADKRPASITVILKQNGVQYGNAITLDSNNGWEYTWNNLPVYTDDNVKYVYTVEEASVPEGYTSVVTYPEAGEALITNTILVEDTYGLKINKTSKTTGDGLNGAVFNLRDKATGELLTFTETSGNSHTYNFDPESKNTELRTGADGVLVINGLKKGTYVVIETKAPAGYQLAEDKEVEISGDVDIAETTIVDEELEYNLPSAGGIGTTIFYVIGSILVLAAIILLITKFRMKDR